MRGKTHRITVLILTLCALLMLWPIVAAAQEEGEPADEDTTAESQEAETEAETEAEDVEEAAEDTDEEAEEATEDADEVEEAADETDEEEAEGPLGLGLAMLLLGLGGVSVVGMTMISRDRNPVEPNNDSPY